MAIAFLNDITLSDNELQNVVIQRLATDPTGVEGKIIYNNGSNKLKFYNGTEWVSLGGMGGSGTVGSVPVFVTNSTTIGDSRLETTGTGSNQTFTFNSDGDVATKGSFSLLSAGGIKDKDGDLGTSGQLLSSTGTQVNWIAAPVSYTKWIAKDFANTTENVNDGDTFFIDESTTNPGILTAPISKSGTTITQPLNLIAKNVANVAPSTFSTDVLLWSPDTEASNWKFNKTHIDDVPLSAWGDATETINMGGKQILSLANPINVQDAATKSYVDSSVAGGLTVKGGFNASSGAIGAGGQLFDSATRVAIAVGDYYIATVAGDFFGQASIPLTPGDSVLVQTAAAVGASQPTDFAIIQSDTDLATISTVGIGNTNIDGTGDKDGLSLTYTTGTAKLGLDILSLAASAAVKDIDPGTVSFPIHNDEGTGNEKITLKQIQEGISASAIGVLTAASTVVTHNLGTRDVIVQLYDGSTYDTVYADVSRTSINTVTVAFASTPASTIRCMIYAVNIQGV